MLFHFSLGNLSSNSHNGFGGISGHVWKQQDTYCRKNTLLHIFSHSDSFLNKLLNAQMHTDCFIENSAMIHIHLYYLSDPARVIRMILLLGLLHPIFPEDHQI